MSPPLRFFALFFLLHQALVFGADPARPNIIFIVADDLGINDLACYGRQDHRTPNLDRLAAEGMRFTTAYAAQPVCSPTRAALMTGKAPARLHLTTFLPGRADAPSQRVLQPQIAMELPLEEQTIAEMLKPAGYVTGCLGKWHLGGPGCGSKEQGFDWESPGRPTTKPSAFEGGKGEYALTEMAEQFIDTNKNRPFFLYLAHHNPHIPLGAKTELVTKNRAAFNPVYAAMIETLDECVGRIMARLETLHLTQRTMVIFTSDNGGLHVPELTEAPATHNSPYRAGKGFIYEGGLRIPLIVRWPGRIAAGSTNATPVISTDWVPTWLEATGVPAPGLLDGVSLLPLLTGGQLAERALCWHFPHYSNQGGRPAGAIRRGDWKLVEQYEDGRAELFDLARDPGERTDLSMKEPERAADLRSQLTAWRAAVGAQENTPNPRFDMELARLLYHDVDISRLAPAETAEKMREGLRAWRGTMDAAVKKNLLSTDARPVIVLPWRESSSSAEGGPSWEFDVESPGDYAVEALYGCGHEQSGAPLEIGVNGQTLAAKVENTGHSENFVPRVIGHVTLTAGKCTVVLQPKVARSAINLRQVVLVPSESERDL